MATYNATGITLAVHKYGDTGRVATFFTRERGKVEAAASGIGKPGSKLAAAVEPFTVSRLMFAEGKNMDRLSQAEVVEAFYVLRQDLERLAYGSYLLELTDLTTEPHEPLPELFDDLLAGLQAIAEGGDADLISLAFTLRLLAAHGTAPELSVCLECGEALAGEVGYAPMHGGFVCRRCSPGTGGRLTVSGAALGALRGLLTLPPERLGRLVLKAEVRRELSQVVRSHTDYHVGEQMKSRKFLDKLRR